MTPQKLRALQAEILADEECKPFVVTADDEKTDAIERDRAIAAIRNDKRPPRLRPHMISERGVRASLSILEGAALIKTLRDLSAATDMPKWLSDVLAAVHVPAEMQWAYFDTMPLNSPQYDLLTTTKTFLFGKGLTTDSPFIPA